MEILDIDGNVVFEPYIPGTYEYNVQDAAVACLNSIPDDVILDMATRSFDMHHPNSCVCGWAFRAGIMQMVESNRPEVNTKLNRYSYGVNPESHSTDELVDIVDHNSRVAYERTDLACLDLFNKATPFQWNYLYHSVCSDRGLAVVELEFVNRVNRAVENQTPKSTKKRSPKKKAKKRAR